MFALEYFIHLYLKNKKQAEYLGKLFTRPGSLPEQRRGVHSAILQTSLLKK
jgi:hypothetical protein